MQLPSMVSTRNSRTHIGLNEDIDAARNILHRCWFDEVKCVKGISALEAYKKEWNDKHGC